MKGSNLGWLKSDSTIASPRQWRSRPCYGLSRLARVTRIMKVFRILVKHLFFCLYFFGVVAVWWQKKHGFSSRWDGDSLKEMVDGRRFPFQVNIFHQDGVASYVFIIHAYKFCMILYYVCTRMHIVNMIIYLYNRYIFRGSPTTIFYRLVYKPPFLSKDLSSSTRNHPFVKWLATTSREYYIYIHILLPYTHDDDNPTDEFRQILWVIPLMEILHIKTL